MKNRELSADNLVIVQWNKAEVESKSLIFLSKSISNNNNLTNKVSQQKKKKINNECI